MLKNCPFSANLIELLKTKFAFALTATIKPCPTEIVSDGFCVPFVDFTPPEAVRIA
jgi:hypothetical protein